MSSTSKNSGFGYSEVYEGVDIVYMCSVKFSWHWSNTGVMLHGFPQTLLNQMFKFIEKNQLSTPNFLQILRKSETVGMYENIWNSGIHTAFSDDGGDTTTNNRVVWILIQLIYVK